jgi:hypothetical protein
MKYIKYLILGLFSVGILGCSSSTDVPDHEIIRFLKYNLKDEGFKWLDCYGNNPTFKILDNPDPTRETTWQKQVLPSRATLTFKATLNIAGEDSLIVGSLNVKARHRRYELLSRSDYINFSISMNEWHFVNPGENSDDYCDWFTGLFTRKFHWLNGT